MPEQHNERAGGYYAIVIPDQEVWLGFLLDHTYDFHAGRMVGALDCSIDGAAYAHLNNREQAMVGILSTMLAYEITNADLSQAPITATAIARTACRRDYHGGHGHNSHDTGNRP